MEDEKVSGMLRERRSVVSGMQGYLQGSQKF